MGAQQKQPPPPPKKIPGETEKATCKAAAIQRDELLLLHVQEPATGRAHTTFYVTHKAYSVQ